MGESSILFCVDCVGSGDFAMSFWNRAIRAVFNRNTIIAARPTRTALILALEMTGPPLDILLWQPQLALN
jgi:hypothetical protein